MLAAEKTRLSSTATVPMRAEVRIHIEWLEQRIADIDEQLFIYRARWFVLTQTEGQQLEPITIPECQDANSRDPSERIQFGFA